jgi:hypothetical protein
VGDPGPKILLRHGRFLQGPPFSWRPLIRLGNFYTTYTQEGVQMRHIVCAVFGLDALIRESGDWKVLAWIGAAEPNPGG